MENRWETMETETDFISLDWKITAEIDCSYEMKRRLLLGRKAMMNLDNVLNNRDITLPINVYIVKAMVFPGAMYRYESWTLKKAEHWSIDAFKLWCWRRLLRVSWIAGRSNYSILKEINHEYLLELLILNLKLQYFSYLIQRADSLEKILMLGNIEGKKRGRGQRTRWLDSIMDSMDMSLNKLWKMGDGERQGSLRCCSPSGHKGLDTTEWLNNMGFCYFFGKK